MKTMRRKHIIVTCVLLFPCRVVNSDNMSIIGVTIDYGPYGFLDYYDPNYLSQSSGEYQVNCSQYPLTCGSSCFNMFWHYEINERKFSPILSLIWKYFLISHFYFVSIFLLFYWSLGLKLLNFQQFIISMGTTRPVSILVNIWLMAYINSRISCPLILVSCVLRTESFIFHFKKLLRWF